MIKLLIGGSPCTKWSITQSKDREVEPNGEGWELFRNFLIAREKYKPDYFLYENNKSAAKPIKEQISRELGVELQYINSALVSAQSRQRFYAHNIPGVPQPEDRGILLRDILEYGGTSDKEKAYTLRASAGTKQGMCNVVRHITSGGQFGYQGVFVPVRVGYLPNEKGELHTRQSKRVYSISGKSVSLCAAKNAGGTSDTSGGRTGLYACPAIYQAGHGFNAGGVKYNKSPTLTATGDWAHNNFVIEAADGKVHPIYEVAGGLIAIKGKQYPIKLADGFYIIRKLTVTECKRLQTVPDDYIMPCSDTQNYKMLGNGWTVDVIAHILSCILGIREQEIDVLSMYDGMSCGRIALNKLGANVVRYRATEIDKYAIQTTMANFPDTIQLGDAFQVRDETWKP